MRFAIAYNTINEEKIQDIFQKNKNEAEKLLTLKTLNSVQKEKNSVKLTPVEKITKETSILFGKNQPTINADYSDHTFQPQNYAHAVIDEYANKVKQLFILE